jgi:RHS repeat-associated protein
LGSTRQVISTSGSVLDAITYDPYGSIVSQTNASNAPRFLYAGGAYDSLTGNYQFGARWERPTDGNWTSQDPLGLGPDTNPYRYVGNSPTDAIDRNGMILGPLFLGLFVPPNDSAVAAALIAQANLWVQRGGKRGLLLITPNSANIVVLQSAIQKWKWEFTLVMSV